MLVFAFEHLLAHQGMQYPAVDYLLYSRHHSAWQCIDTVRRNNTLITNVPWEEYWRREGRITSLDPKFTPQIFQLV